MILRVDSFQIASSQIYGNVIEKEYYFGLSHFQESVDSSRANLSNAEIIFLTENLNLMVKYGESLMFQSKKLFDNYGFIVDAKRVFLFVSNVRKGIRSGITQTFSKHSSSQIIQNLSKVYQTFSMNLKNVFDREILKMHIAMNRNDTTSDAEECWEAYKIPMFEIGFDVVNQVRILSSYEAVRLTNQLEWMRLDVSDNINQLIIDLSMASSTVFPTRLRVNTYVSSN